MEKVKEKYRKGKRSECCCVKDIVFFVRGLGDVEVKEIN